MSTERDNLNKIVFVCDADGCGETLETGYSTWSYANEDRKRCGWYTMQIAGEWMHFCPPHGKAEWLARKNEKQ